MTQTRGSTQAVAAMFKEKASTKEASTVPWKSDRNLVTLSERVLDLMSPGWQMRNKATFLSV